MANGKKWSEKRAGKKKIFFARLGTLNASGKISAKMKRKNAKLSKMFLSVETAEKGRDAPEWLKMRKQGVCNWLQTWHAMSYATK